MKARSPILRLLAWRALRFVIAGLLLWIDLRLFLLYAFLIMVRVLEAVDYVRATVRVFQLMNDLRWVALMRQLDLTEDALQRALDDYREQADDRIMRSLLRDWALCIGRPCTAEEAFASDHQGMTLLKRTRSPRAPR